MSIVILHGGQGSGKTTIAESLMLGFGCTRMVDEWDGKAQLNEGDFAVTNMEPPFSVAGAIVIKCHINELCKLEVQA